MPHFKPCDYHSIGGFKVQIREVLHCQISGSFKSAGISANTKEDNPLTESPLVQVSPERSKKWLRVEGGIKFTD